jgi:hypothetical protein
MEDIVIINHPSPIWPGARHLCVAETGRLLAITRGDLLHAAAARMIDEGYSPASTLIIRDAHDEAADITGTIKDALA